jgi:putative ABC transport system permease protein
MSDSNIMWHGIGKLNGNIFCMLTHYIYTGFGMLRKNKFYSLINIIGLGIGITVSLLILVYILNEMSYERFQRHRDNIYRINLLWGSEGSEMKFAGVMPALAPAINAEIPEARLAVRIRRDYDALITTADNQKISESNLFFADSGLFDVFSIDLVSGNPKTVLAEPYSIVLTESMAKKYFGNSDPVGKVLNYNKVPLKINGVIADIPPNTHFMCDFLVSFITLRSMGEKFDQPWNRWGEDLTYVLMKDKVAGAVILPKLKELLSHNAGSWLSAKMKFDIQPLRDIHWDTETRGDIGSKGNKTYVLIFLAAAVFILVIACFNFLNLSISQYLGRIREIGARKTAGALSRHLIAQFITESMIIILISSLISVYLFDGIYLKLYSYLGTTFVLGQAVFLLLAALVIAIVLIIGIFSAVYPAVFISGFNPIEILRKETTGAGKKLVFRKMLIIFQFTISIILMIGTIAVFRQLEYMRNSDLGFKKDDVVVLNFPGTTPSVSSRYEVIRDEMLKDQNVKAVSGSYTIPGVQSQMNISVQIDSAAPENALTMQAIPADFGFVSALGLTIAEGRDLSREFSTDRNESVLLNEEAVKVLGLSKPLGTKLKIPGDDYKNGVRVIGVVKNFHIQSFHNKIVPMIIYINPGMFMQIIARSVPGKAEETLTYFRSAWKNIMPDTPLVTSFLSVNYDNLYNSEKKTGQVLAIFTLLALFISCLGLFGFSSFILARQVKSVGIRKVMGARLISISWQLYGQFLIWIIISGLIACPAAYILVNKWLQNFAFHININFWILFVAIGFNLLITMLTVSFQTWRTAVRNPVEALRYE